MTTPISGQTIAYQFSVTSSFDGLTTADNASASNDEDQFYVATQPLAGVFPVNDPSEYQPLTSRGNRWVDWLELRLTAPAPSGSKIQIVDNTSPGGMVVLKEVADVSGETLVYIDQGFMVPQGSALSVVGPGVGTLRYHITFLDPQSAALVASLVINRQSSVSEMVFSDEVASSAGDTQLEVGVIQLYDASGLVDGDLRLVLPDSPANNQVTGIKEVGDSAVAVTLDGNGNLVESALSSPAATQSVAIARQSLTLKYDGPAGTWWIV